VFGQNVQCLGVKIGSNYCFPFQLTNRVCEWHTCCSSMCNRFVCRYALTMCEVLTWELHRESAKASGNYRRVSLAAANCLTLVFWSWMEAAIRLAVEATHSQDTLVTICTTLFTFKEFQSFVLFSQYWYAPQKTFRSTTDGIYDGGPIIL
jgi:hypothetical protein